MIVFDQVVWKVVLLALLLAAAPVAAQEWAAPVRGSWVQTGEAAEGDVMLASPGGPVAQIVVGEDEESPVRRAAEFLAGDIEQISGQRPEIVAEAETGAPAIHLVTLGTPAEASIPESIDKEKLRGQWEAHRILTDDQTVWLVGSNPRGTAFAAYTLCERLGVDPLHIWSGYVPGRHETLVLKTTDYSAGPPTVKYRGFFHDDEDILPRPFDYAGRPLSMGDVPLSWYERFFETALRLRMNMVAPYTRVHRRFEVQKTASDWGLFYTSHHYDILLSNPHGFTRFGLAEKRGVTGDWDWLQNRENMLKYWGAGVVENGRLDCIWPVGLRGTDDHPYGFPEGMPLEEQNRIFREVIDTQIEVTRELVPEGKEPVFHFTLYGEMLDKYLGSGGNFDMPQGVIVIWPDDNDGRIRALPTDANRGDWKHGVYYHLAYLWSVVTKQSANMVPANRVADSFKKIVEAGATEYILTNVSEMREFVREARMIAEICWDAETALGDMPLRPMPEKPLAHVPVHATEPLPPDIASPSADRYARWFSTEYFGEAAADDVTEFYRRRDMLLDSPEKLWIGNDKVNGALDSLTKKFAGEEFAPARAETLPELMELAAQYEEALAIAERAKSKMTPAQRQFFHDLAELPMLMAYRPIQAAILLVEAMGESDLTKAWALCREAMRPLEQLEVEILRAEHPPFEDWYRKTWIRHEHTAVNPHQAYETLRVFLSSEGREQLQRSPLLDQPVQQFVPLLKEELPGR